MDRRTHVPESKSAAAPLAPEYNMGGFLRRNELNAFVYQSAHVNPLEQSLAPAKQDRRDSEVQLIDEARTKILLDSVRVRRQCAHPLRWLRRAPGQAPREYRPVDEMTGASGAPVIIAAPITSGV